MAVIPFFLFTRGIEERDWHLEEVLSIGRHDENIIALPGRSVSRSHAQITKDGQDFFIVDQESGNGTFLNYSLFGPSYEPWVVMILPPGGFLTLGFLLMAISWVQRRRARRREEETEGGVVARERAA